MTDFIQAMLNELTGGRGKLLIGKDTNDLLSKVREEIQSIQAEDCGNPECPVHGDDVSKPKMPKSMQGIDFNDMDPIQASQLAAGAATGAQGLIEVGEFKSAKVMQEQSFLWLQIGESLKELYSTSNLLREQEKEFQQRSMALVEERDALRLALDDVKKMNEDLTRQLEVAEEE